MANTSLPEPIEFDIPVQFGVQTQDLLPCKLEFDDLDDSHEELLEELPWTPKKKKRNKKKPQKNLKKMKMRKLPSKIGQRKRQKNAPKKNLKYGYKGISMQKKSGRWIAIIHLPRHLVGEKVKRPLRYLGIFNSKEDAAWRYDEEHFKHYGSRVNFPDGKMETKEKIKSLRIKKEKLQEKKQCKVIDIKKARQIKKHEREMKKNQDIILRHVSCITQTGQYLAEIEINGKLKYLGRFEKLRQAIEHFCNRYNKKNQSNITIPLDLQKFRRMLLPSDHKSFTTRRI